MPSLSARVMHLASRLLVKRVMNQPTFDLRKVRRAMAARTTMPAALPRGLRVDPSPAFPLRGEWQTPQRLQGEGVILFLHGGGYLAGSPRTHRSCSAWLAHHAQLRLFSLDYRLAPEHPYPAALEDAVGAVRALVASGVPASKLVLAGDSAGAGLVLAALLRLRELGQAMPAAAALLCPLTDLTGSGDSMRRNADAEPLLGLRHREQAMRLYAGDLPFEHPMLSPLLADLRGLPPLFVQASRMEILWDDARRLVDAAAAAGVQVELDAWDGLGHDWQLTVPFTPEAREAVRRLAAWCAARVA